MQIHTYRIWSVRMWVVVHGGFSSELNWLPSEGLYQVTGLLDEIKGEER